jgi:DNA polymerase-3 subunit epsilon
MIKELWVDVETTGLNAYRNGIWQVAGKIIIDGEVTDEFDLKCNVYEKDQIDSEALKLNELTKKDLKSFEPAKMTYGKFVRMLDTYVNKYERNDKFIMFGYNVRFDEDFLRSWFMKAGNKYWGSYIHYPPIDVMALAADALKHERKNMKDFKQGTVAKKLGLSLEDEKLHDALYDIDITRRIYNVLHQEQGELFETIQVTKEASVVKRKDSPKSNS